MKVAILANEEISLFELACAVELFALPRPEITNWYQTEVVSLLENEKHSTGGMRITCKTVTDFTDYDTLIIPSWPITQRDISAQLSTQIKQFYAQGKRILTFCSGSFLLAELGLLENQNAITHWRYAEAFKQRFPRVNYVDNALYVLGPQIGCSAGSAAGLDLGLAVIRNDFGFATANQVARRLVVSTHRQGGQAQFVETPIPKIDNHFSSALDWAIKHLDKGINVDTLAMKANMSRRSFDRKFSATFSMAPNAWLTSQRINKAKELLENQPWPIERIAEAAGFETAVTMRHHFAKQLGISPKAYRQQFGRT